MENFEKYLTSDSLKILELEVFVRRLAGKTQVYPPEMGLSNRQTHTLDVTRIGVELAERINLTLGLDLSISLIVSIALGHDLGHTPYGHMGEKFISDFFGIKFSHGLFGVWVAQEEDMFFSQDVLAGICNHDEGFSQLCVVDGLSLELLIVKISDRIAYISADIGDALSLGFQMPGWVEQWGKTKAERIRKMVDSVVEETKEENQISFCKSKDAKSFEEVRQWMFENIYRQVNKNEEWFSFPKFQKVIKKIDGMNMELDPIIIFSLMTYWEVETFWNWDGISLEHFPFFQKRLPRLQGKRWKDFDFK